MLCSAALGQSPTARVRIQGTVDDNNRTRLQRNTQPLAQAQYDIGPAPDNLTMDRMLLVLTRSPEQSAALQELIAQQQDPNSPNYHHWLTPQQIGEQFGVALQDLQTITDWLSGHGFTVAGVSPTGNVIEFSGTAAQVREAFHTEIRRYSVNGEEHVANASDPEIPSALAPVVAGVLTLHNFYKKPAHVQGKSGTGTVTSPGAAPSFTYTSTEHFLAPADFATIYNVNPLYTASINGSGQTIAIVGRTNINPSDMTDFRSLFVPSNPSNVPSVIVNGTNPGDLGGGEETEADLDLEWSGAVAPNATIKFVVSASTGSTDGVDLSANYIVNNKVGSVMSTSFGECEQSLGSSENSFYEILWQNAAGEGITAMVASDDSGSAGCDSATGGLASGGFAVNGLASTPYNVAVGGTGFNDTASPSTYWASSNNSNYSSALGYIPELVWNETCAPASCGTTGAIYASGGGASTLYAKPGWQTGTGVPGDGARDVPDLALAASGRVGYIVCQDRACRVKSGSFSFEVVGGTSASSPSFAGIMALVDQKQGSAQGFVNQTLYTMAAGESLASCNSASPASNCIFNDVSSGTNAVPCVGASPDCSSTNASVPGEMNGFSATTGFDLATGWGSVNVANLVNDWSPTGGVAAAIAPSGGATQSTTVNTAFGTALAATVADKNGNPVADTTVTFTAPSSGATGTFQNGTHTTTASTNSSGIATASAFTAGTVAGAFTITASVSGVSSNANFNLTNNAGAAASIVATGGTPQSAVISTAFASPLQATVKDQYGNLVSGANVTFTAPGTANVPSGTFATSSNSTNVSTSAGIAISTTFTANAIAGNYSVTASVTGVSGSTSFSLSNTAGAPASIAVSTGSSQTVTIGNVFSTLLQAVVKDGSNNPVASAVVTFTAPGSGASGTFANGQATTTASTNNSGIAVASVFTANSIAGAYSVNASVAGVSQGTSFSLTNTPGSPVAIAVSAGSGQSAVVGIAFASTLQAIVRDAGGNPVPQVTVTFAPPASGAGASLGSPSATTNAAGIATTAATANNIAGSYSVSASVAGASVPAVFNLTNTPGSPASIVATGGGGQSATVLTAFANPLQATVKDSFGNPVPNASVTFSSPPTGPGATFTSGTATTNASGVASTGATANGTAGGYSVTASVGGVATNATFNLTNNPGAASAIAPTSGSGQSATIQAGFGAPLVAMVTDAGGNPIANAMVTFTAPGSGAGAVFSNGTAQITIATGANGQASAQPTANKTAGSYSVTATAAGVTGSASFSLTNNAGTAAVIATTSGGGQATTIQTAFGAPLVATVTDAGANPVANAMVTFTAPGSGTGAVFSNGTAQITVATGATGQASAQPTANKTAGSYTVTATATGVTGSASFSLTNNAGTAAAIVATSGGGQSATIQTAFGSPLVATVTDAGGNPVTNAMVTFAAPGSGAGAVFSNGTSQITVATGANGQASALASASKTAGAYNVTATVTGVFGGAAFGVTNSVGAAAAIAAYAGSGQSATVHTAFATLLQALVTDTGGNPIANATVTFSVWTKGGASGGFASGLTSTGVTNAAGVATANVLTANSNVGTWVATAAANGVTATASFNLTNLALASAISATSGSGQSATIQSAFGAPLVALVTDGGGNPVANAMVTFTAPASNASAVFSNGAGQITIATGANGQASAPISANKIAGAYSVSAAVQGVAAGAIFNLTNIAGQPASIVATSGGGQSAPISTTFGAPLVATVTDAGGNPVANAMVTFTAPGSGAGAVFSNGNAQIVISTGANGQASAPVSANKNAGAYSVTAAVSGVAGNVSFNLTNNSSTAASIAATSGSGQAATIQTAFGAPLVATVTDSGGNPVANAVVMFTAPGSNASAVFSNGIGQISIATGANGQASAPLSANKTAGSYTVTAAVAGVGSNVSFSLTNNAGAASAIGATSGGGQSATIQTAFGTPLVATVTDAGGNPVANAMVTFAAPGSGAGAVFSNGNAQITVATGANGQASAPLSASKTAGSYSVTASTAGVAGNTSFNLTNNAGAASAIAASSGGGQSATIQTAFGAPLVAMVIDAGGNPVVNAMVTFTAPGSGASAFFSNGNAQITAATGANGQASVPLSANRTAGDYSVTASVASVGGNASFSLTNNSGAATVVTAASGGGQSTQVSTAFAAPLVATVTDGGGNPVPGATVTFTAPGASASAVFSNGMATIAIATGANGQASVPLTANQTAGAYNVTASVAGVSPNASYSLTNTAPAGPAAVAVFAGSGQSATVHTAFGTLLQAVVTDAVGNPLANVTVTFAVWTHGGPSGNFASGLTATAVTNSSGVATANALTANAQVGSWTATATVAGVANPANFSLTNTASN